MAGEQINGRSQEPRVSVQTAKKKKKKERKKERNSEIPRRTLPLKTCLTSSEIP
jgi:hypothetical protein